MLKRFIAAHLMSSEAAKGLSFSLSLSSTLPRTPVHYDIICEAEYLSVRSLHTPIPLDNQSFDLVPHLNDLVLQRRCLVASDGCGDDATAHTTRTAKSTLAGHEDIANVFVFGQERDVEQDGKRRSVGSEDDNLGNLYS